MVERVFLGWDEPFLSKALAWLLERRKQLPGMLVVVPTSENGRRLKEALAEMAGAILSPRITTPGSFLQARDHEAAPRWMERVAWAEVLENIDDWSLYEALLPESPAADEDWAVPLAGEMIALRESLQENGLLLSSAARRLRESVDGDRWEAMGKLETLVERKLFSWNTRSRSAVLSEGIAQPDGIQQIVFAGIAELPPLVERSIFQWNLAITALVGAPPNEAASFDLLGIPIDTAWNHRPLESANGSIQVVADARQQAAEALKKVAESGTSSDDVVLGSADAEVGEELARAFAREGWIAFHPAAISIPDGLTRWFKLWNRWLADATLSVLADLFTLPETAIISGGKRAKNAELLDQIRDKRMIARPDDLRRYYSSLTKIEPRHNDLLEALEKLEGWRTSMLSGDFAATTSRLLGIFALRDESKEIAMAMDEWLHGASDLIRRIRRAPSFWVEMMISEVPPAIPRPPEGRVVNVQGWLELFHEAGSHLILCGMNEGKVPARGGGEPWLGEAGRKSLGLTLDSQRAARDTYLYHAMLSARLNGGRVDIFCGKAGSGGEPLLPSRLLLSTSRQQLPSRVNLLFRDVEPPEAGLRWHREWQWQPSSEKLPKRISVTSLADYLSCPFRYFLKHVMAMQEPEASRMEWNARDFGTVAHDVLERWGLDKTARCSEDPDEIHQWLSDELDRVVAEWFGTRIPLAVRIQTESLRQRFQWLARIQATHRQAGWEIIEVERKVEIQAGEAQIIAKIDRIDQHRETGELLVIDYKTGKVDSVDKAHRRKITASTVIPEHLDAEGPAIYTGDANGKSANFLWQNLQLPLYAAAAFRRGMPLPTPCYFTLRSTEAEVAIHRWDEFSLDDLVAAENCAQWIAQQVSDGVFWPPSEKTVYDDYAVLAAGRNLPEMVLPPDLVAPTT